MTILQRTGQLPLQTYGDIVLCRLQVRRVTEILEFTSVGQTMLVTAASELARNAVVYGGGGVLAWEVLHADGHRVGMRLTFEDHGPGIPNVPLAMTDRWASGKGLGLGLSGAKRLVHHFSISTVVGKGTTVTVTRWK